MEEPSALVAVFSVSARGGTKNIFLGGAALWHLRPLSSNEIYGDRLQSRFYINSHRPSASVSVSATDS